MLYGENLVHAFDAEAAFFVEEVGDVGLFESGLLGEMKTGKLSCFDALPKNFAQILLQDPELHIGRSIAPGYSWR